MPEATFLSRAAQGPKERPEVGGPFSPLAVRELDVEVVGRPHSRSGLYGLYFKDNRVFIAGVT